MSSFWDHSYDKYKDRRYGALFLSCLLACLAVLILGAAVDAILRGLGLERYFLDALPGSGLLGLAWCFLRFRQAQMRGREKVPRPPLSRDEARVARSKLRNDMKPTRQRAPRIPDTNLKY